MSVKRSSSKRVSVNPAQIAISNIAKRLGVKGKPAIRVIDNKEDFDIETYSFGSPEIDEASNCGGAPRGKLVEIFGPESSGKSYLSLQLMASAQKKGGVVCLFDIEQSFDPRWAKRHGVSIDQDKFLYFNESMCAEETLDYIYEACREPNISLVVVYSTAALIPRKELEGSVGKDEVALLARAMSRACSKITHACESANTLCVFINQVRDALNTRGFGNPTTTPGGRALKFHSSMRLSVYPGAKVKAKNSKGDDEVIATSSYVTFVKNKIASPFGRAEFEIIFDEMAMNPIVKMVKAAKLYRIITSYKGEYFLNRKYIDESLKKNIPTNTKSFPELADFLLRNEDKMEIILDSLLNELEEEFNEERLKIIDPIIYKIKDDKSLWVSPLADMDSISVKENEIKSTEEIVKEQGDQDSIDL